MASPRLDVGQGALAWFVAGSLVLASACSSDSNVDFDPTAPSGGSDTSSGGSKPSGNGGGSGAAKGGSNGTSGEAQGGTSNSAGSSAAAGKSSGGIGGTTNNGGTTSSGGKAGGANGGSNAGGGKAGNGGTANNGGSAGASANAGNGGSAGGGDGDCVLATFGGHSYYFCGVVDSAPAAYAKCQSLGMKMVEIESLAEQAFVIGKQKGQSWLGGTDELKEGEWRWATTMQVFWDGGPRGDFGGNDSRVDGVYSNFIVGQPNNDNLDGFPENCLASNANGWNDLYCNLTGLRAACEGAGPVVQPKP
jgi:Lectin C-type domain